jgi:hypothetical protein
MKTNHMQVFLADCIECDALYMSSAILHELSSEWLHEALISSGP